MEKLNKTQAGKTALITGSYGGLGSCFAKIHASRSGNLLLVGRDATKLEAQASSLRNKYNITVNTIAADLSLPNSAQIIYDACKKTGVTINYLINNAGFGGQGEFATRTMESDLSMIAVNIEAVVKLCKLFLPDFIARKSGRVLNVSSTAAFMAGPLQAVYFATKAFVTSFSNALYRELKNSPVTVTTLMPGAMNTPFITRGNLEGTKLFSIKTMPDSVALAGYNGMLKGRLNVIAGLLWWQKPLIKLLPLLSKNFALDFIYKEQCVAKNTKI